MHVFMLIPYEKDLLKCSKQAMFIEVLIFNLKFVYTNGYTIYLRNENTLIFVPIIPLVFMKCKLKEEIYQASQKFRNILILSAPKY